MLKVRLFLSYAVVGIWLVLFYPLVVYYLLCLAYNAETKSLLPVREILRLTEIFCVSPYPAQYINFKNRVQTRPRFTKFGVTRSRRKGPTLSRPKLSNTLLHHNI